MKFCEVFSHAIINNDNHDAINNTTNNTNNKRNNNDNKIQNSCFGTALLKPYNRLQISSTQNILILVKCS